MSTYAMRGTGLSKRYGALWALRGCNLSIEPGTVVALVGPNGAGKSTLLNLLTGLVEPTEGELRVFGLPVTGAVRDHVSYTAQGHPLYPQFSVADMLRAGRSLNTRWDQAAAVARMRELDIPLSRKVGELSGGQQAQVSLALALARQPRLVLLDEPVAALDPVARREFMQILMGVAAERELTVVLSSHVVSELERVCDYLIALSRGTVQVAGKVDDLLAEHLLLTGPSEAAETLHRTQTVVSASTTGRQSTVLIRRGRHPIDPVWKAASVGLEELVLTYLQHPDAGALPGPRTVASGGSA